ncbi:Imm1 family immunity protein [Actinokineospora bangkokensis]|uniref:Immunity protein Imm1 n=1 Tax=Actinokineospora bangkokensis TaxID=1193682 RepID=A0A1Q9LKL3_9PSEU|nr:Imm1 family immunity protein [Actinokineospora bangkokensis]OLR92591.1 hypothetical protein BJP25_21305 [Actinokineospora bangkokensis]
MKQLALWYFVEQEDDHLAATEQELDAALNAVLARGDERWWPVAEVTLADEPDTSPTLYVGLRGEVGVVRYSPADEYRSYYSRNPQSSDVSPIMYMYHENEFEVPINAQVPIADVRRAVAEFATTGQRPDCLHWQEWKAPATTGSEYPGTLPQEK